MSPETQLGALVGSVLGGAYQITRLLGEGGMGWVYEARQLRLNKRVAVKLMARELAANPEALARFHREAEVTSHLGHPHLVSVIDFGITDHGEPYLVMEYLDGEDLDHRIRRAGRLPLETAVEITKQVASALAAAHDEGVVHRDLKPANVFLVKVKGEADFVKVLDFGVSKIKAARTKLTRATAVIGTPEYMSPEQATGLIEEIDHRADQWALGCIAWEMLSGHAPFIADDMGALFYQVINMDPHPLARRAPGLPPEVEQVLRRALAKRAAERFPSIKDFARAFEAAAAGRKVAVTDPPVDWEAKTEIATSSSSLPEELVTTRRDEELPHQMPVWRRRRFYLAAVGAVAVLVVLLILLWPRSSPSPTNRLAPAAVTPVVPVISDLPPPAAVVPPPPAPVAPARAPKPKPRATVPDGQPAGPAKPSPFATPERVRSKPSEAGPKPARLPPPRKIVEEL